LNSAVAAYYYLRILVVMWFQEPGEAATDAPEASFGVKAVLAGSAIATIALGIVPSLVLDYATRSANIVK